MNQGHVLVRDEEGWAKLYDLDRGQEGELAEHYRQAEIVSESPGTAFWLPYDRPVVLPLVATSATGPYNEDDYAVCDVNFTVPGTQEPVLSVSYAVDGRA